MVPPVGAAERRKGATGERELVTLLRAYGIDADRVSPLEAGGAGFGDVRDAHGNTWQVKRRRALALYGWIVGCDRLAVRADRQDWLVVLTLQDYLAMAKGGVEHGPADAARVVDGGEGAATGGG